MAAVKKGRKSKEPDDKNSFGYVLWQILGGDNINVGEAASHLGISGSFLVRRLRGQNKPTQEFIQDSNWRTIFVEKYPDGWAAFKDVFENKVRGLKGARRFPTKEPEDKNSFGYVLWQILGGENIKVGQAASHLGIKGPHLTQYLHDHSKPTQKHIKDGNWRGILAEKYPDAWALYAATFETRAARLPLTKGRSPEYEANPAAQAKVIQSATLPWQKAVGTFIRDVLAFSGDAVDEMIGEIKAPALRKNFAVVAGFSEPKSDVAIPLSLFRNAVEEICALYQLDTENPTSEHEITAAKLLERAPV